MSLIDCMFHGIEYFTAFKFFINDVMSELDLPPYVISYHTERNKWESASLLLHVQASNDLTYTRAETDGTTKTYFVSNTTAPTRIMNRWVLPLSGPRPAEGDESNFINIWRDPNNEPQPIPPPPTSTGGVTLAELREEWRRHPYVTLQQLRDELRNQPSSSGSSCVTLSDLIHELDRRPCTGVSLPQLQRELSMRPCGNRGITLTELQHELDARYVPRPGPGVPGEEDVGGYTQLHPRNCFQYHGYKGPIKIKFLTDRKGTKYRTVDYFKIKWKGGLLMELDYLREGKDGDRTREDVVDFYVESRMRRYVNDCSYVPDSMYSSDEGSPRPHRGRGGTSSAEKARYKTWVSRADTDLSNQTNRLVGMHGPTLLTNLGQDVHSWRQPMWMIRDQMMMWGNYVEGLEEMGVPHPGGFQHYATYSRNQNRIRDYLKKRLNLKLLNE
jgi:hypothetical protein